MTRLTIDVIGTPAPAGSKRAFVVNGRARMAESSTKLRPWWQAVAGATQAALEQAPAGVYPLLGPVEVTIQFHMPRPRYHYRSGARAHELKPGAPTYVDKKPDSDKCARSVLDALKAVGVYRDDAQVAVLAVSQEYANATTGARILVAPLTDPTVDVGEPRDDTTPEGLF